MLFPWLPSGRRPPNGFICVTSPVCRRPSYGALAPASVWIDQSMLQEIQIPAYMVNQPYKLLFGFTSTLSCYILSALPPVLVLAVVIYCPLSRGSFKHLAGRARRRREQLRGLMRPTATSHHKTCCTLLG